MTPEELDKATADEAWSLLKDDQDVAVIAARLAREGWRPPVDRDVELAMTIARSKHSELADVRAVEATAASVLAGIKAGRKQEQERAKVLVEPDEAHAYGAGQAARLEGIRLGLEAAAKVADYGSDRIAGEWREGCRADNYLQGQSDGMDEVAGLIRALDPEAIAKEADQ